MPFRYKRIKFAGSGRSGNVQVARKRAQANMQRVEVKHAWTLVLDALSQLEQESLEGDSLDDIWDLCQSRNEATDRGLFTLKVEFSSGEVIRISEDGMIILEPASNDPAREVVLDIRELIYAGAVGESTAETVELFSQKSDRLLKRIKTWLMDQFAKNSSSISAYHS